MEKLKRILSTSESPTPVLIRLILAFVFLAAGTQKFLFPEEYGVGRGLSTRYFRRASTLR